MRNWNLESVKSYLKSYQISNELSGVYVYYSERSIQVEFVENNNRGIDKLSQSSILTIIDKLPDEAITNVVDIKNGFLKLGNDLIISELNYRFDFELDFEESEFENNEDDFLSYDLAKKFSPFDNLYYKKVEMKKDFVERYKLKDMTTLENEINLIKNTGNKCKIIEIEKGESHERQNT